MATTFSYAQAAKGISTPAATKPAASTASSVKDVPTTSAGPRNWAEDAQDETSITQPTAPLDSVSKPADGAATQDVDISNVSSPDLGASTSSTVTKDDDVSSLPNTSSDSTWDNKSQASTSVDKSAEPVEKTSEKVKKGKNAVVKPLQDAPLPAVNIWKQRADELKAKVQKAPTPTTNGIAAHKKNETGAHDKSTSNDNRQRSRDDGTQGKKDLRGDSDAKKGTKGRFNDKESKNTPSALPLPPTRDQESWPTPDTAVDEDRKKAQEKGEKVDKDRKEGNSTSTHGKQKWVEVPYTPTVVFNTPLPNAANARRGGRAGGRGGAQAGGRSTGPASNGAEKSEKDASAPDAIPNGELNKRADGSVPSETSPKAKRNGTSTSPTFKTQVPAVNGDASSKSTPAVQDSEVQARRASFSAQIPSQSSSHSRQMNRPSKGRRGDFNAPGDRRRDGASSPNKDNTLDGRSSAGTQTEFANDGERRTNVQEGSNGHHSKQGRYSSYTGGRERGRGGGRGGRGNFSNNHSFTNGHAPQMSASTFPIGPRSPTTFTPENNAYFSAPQSKYGRGGSRSQSVTQDPFRYPYQPAPAPIQTYGMYDYGMMQPMSAVPYGSPFVDQYAHVAMLTTQVNYYFSVDNLIKDTFLRRHMDSQGFVLLGFISGFNRIKQLSTDVEMVKLACQQSNEVEYRTSEDGQERLRRKDDWKRWVLDMAERDQSAQHDGPKELHQPPMPQPAGFDPSSSSQWPVMAPGMAPVTYGEDGTYAQVNGFHGVPQDAAPETFVNGTTNDATSPAAMTNGQSTEAPTS